MNKFYILCPSTAAEYRHMLEKVSPALDDAGISFHICRPGEDIADFILQDKEVTL